MAAPLVVEEFIADLADDGTIPLIFGNDPITPSNFLFITEFSWVYTTIKLKHIARLAINYIPTPTPNKTPLTLKSLVTKSLTRSLLLWPKRLISINVKNSLIKPVRVRRITPVVKIACLFFKVLFLSTNVFKSYKWLPKINNVRFNNDFTSIKKKRVIPTFSWNYIKLKDKIIIRKMPTASLLYNVKNELAKKRRIDKYWWFHRNFTKRYMVLWFLILALSMVTYIGVNKKGLSKQNPLGRVEVFTAGARFVQDCLLSIM